MGSGRRVGSGKKVESGMMVRSSRRVGLWRWLQWHTSSAASVDDDLCPVDARPEACSGEGV